MTWRRVLRLLVRGMVLAGPTAAEPLFNNGLSAIDQDRPGGHRHLRQHLWAVSH